MAKESFDKEDLLALLNDEECDGLEKVKSSITGKSRWSIQYQMIFKEVPSGKFYAANYSVGATESQDEGPFEYDGDRIECEEVRPVEKTVIVYEKVE